MSRKGNWLLWVVILVVAVALYTSGKKDGDLSKPSILLFSKTEGFRHKNIEYGVEKLKELGAREGFAVVHTEDSSHFTEEQLSSFDAVVFFNTTGDVLNDAQQLSFQRYIQAGGGYVGLHAATDTEHKTNSWPWYTRLAGGIFARHPKVQQARIVVNDPSDISTAHLGAEWNVIDEWYDFARLNPNVNVLLSLDETSYEGGKMGEHPIAWKHDFDGGRAFYTGRGHTNEAFDEPEFMVHLAGGISYAIGAGVSKLDYAKSQPEDWRIERDIMAVGIGEPVAMAFTPGGELYIADRKGRLRHYDEALGKAPVVARFDNISHEFEHGFSGMAFDPNYETNNWVYVYYTILNDGPEHQLMRYVFKDNELDHDSGKVLLTVRPSNGCCHEAGMVTFDNKGDLWLSTGDNTNPFESDGFSPHDDRDGRELYDARRSAANTMDRRGKILRITPTDDGGYTIPEGNLFADASDGLPEIYVMGLRNPYRFSIDNRTGILYWGEVGPDAREDSDERGSRGNDEFNRATGPGFFGWPLIIGHQTAYGDYDFDSKTTSGKFDPAAPINDSQYNTGAKQLPPSQEAWIGYPYNLDDQWYELGSGGRTALGGEVYYSGDYPDNDAKLPPYFDGKLFISEFMRRWVKAIDMTDDGTIVKIEPILDNEKFVAPIDMKFAPDGTLWVLEYGSIWFGDNDDSQITRISYNSATNPPPIAGMAVSKTVGAVPMVATLDASASLDRNADDTLSYEWLMTDNEGVEASIGSGVKLDHTFANAGDFTVSLKVTDTAGNVDVATTDLKLGNEPAQITVTFDGDAENFVEGGSLGYAVSIADMEDGSTASGDIDLANVTISLDYVGKSPEEEEAPMGHQQSQIKDITPGQAFINDSDCLSCHHETKESAGPTFTAIAEKYKGVRRAERSLAVKIIEGGSGVWGETAMSAHPDIREIDAREMAMHILSFAEGEHKSLPLEGSLTFAPADKEVEYGVYRLTVTYRDMGGDEAGPIVVEYVHDFEAK